MGRPVPFAASAFVTHRDGDKRQPANIRAASLNSLSGFTQTCLLASLGWSSLRATERVLEAPVTLPRWIRGQALPMFDLRAPALVSAIDTRLRRMTDVKNYSCRRESSRIFLGTPARRSGIAIRDARDAACMSRPCGMWRGRKEADYGERCRYERGRSGFRCPG